MPKVCSVLYIPTKRKIKSNRELVKTSSANKEYIKQQKAKNDVLTLII
jgi:quinolinate synthase